MFVFALGFLYLWATAHAVPTSRSPPTATVRNGTYVGVHSATYNQDFFLGMPYAQQPVGDLRFTVPQPLNQTWSEAREAKQYSDICVGYGVSLRCLIKKRDLLLIQGSPTRFGTPSRKHV